MNPATILAHRPLRCGTALFATVTLALASLSFTPSGYSQPAVGQSSEDKPVAKAAAPAETIRQVMAKPVLAAEKFLADKKYPEALEQIAEAEKIEGKTPYELYVLDRMRATAALGAGNDLLAAKSLESAYASGRIPAAETLAIMDGIARIYYRQKDFKQAAAWAARAVKEPGARIETRLLLGHSAYLSEDFATAKTEVAAFIAAAEKSGTAVTEDQFRLFASAALKTNDNAGYVAGLEKLVVHFPKKEYWADLIHRVETRQGFAERLRLDVYRLKLITGVLSSRGGFLEMAGLCVQDGYLEEGQKVIDAGLAAGALSKDATDAAEKKLRASIGKDLAEERSQSAKGNRPSPKTSIAMINNGFDAVVKGDTVRGLSLMEAGIQAGDLRRIDDARLRFGIALVLAGEKMKASEIFRTVQGTDGTVELAHLWELYSRQIKR